MNRLLSITPSRTNDAPYAPQPILQGGVVVLKVFIDGRQAAASPVMRMLSQAWRFNVEIPHGAKMISLVAMDAVDGSREDFANWANAGFSVRR